MMAVSSTRARMGKSGQKNIIPQVNELIRGIPLAQLLCLLRLGVTLS